MINLTAYEKITKAQNEFSMVRLTNLVALGNIVKAGEIDTTVVSDNGAYITVNGSWNAVSFVGRYVVVGREIVRINESNTSASASNIYIDRAQYGTLNSYEFRNSGYDMEIQPNYSFRTVTIFDTLDWTLNTSSGNSSDPFSFQLESGTVSIGVDSYKPWNRIVQDRTYNLIPKSSCVYLFLGLNGQRVLSYTGFIKRWYFSTSRDGGGRLSIKFFDKFVKWYTKDMDKVFTVNNVNPTQFFEAVLGTPSNMVRYDNGLSSDDIYTVSGVYSKEYDTYADLLSTYYKHAIRFNFDELERIRVFSDLNGSKVQPVTDVVITETNQLDIGQNTENALIINKVTSSYEERKTMYDFDNELNGRAKNFQFSSSNVLYTMLTGDNDFNTLVISDEQLYRRTLIGDYVLFKDESNGMEFYAKVMDKKSNYTSELMLGRFDKDYDLLPRGKYTYLQSLGYASQRSFTLYYGYNELPTIFALTLFNSSGAEVTNNLQYPLIPQVTGVDEAYVDWECKFGSSEDLEIGSYSGYYENITSIYGTFDKTKLLYNREYMQLGNGVNYPYVCALSTTTNTPAGNASDSYLSFDTFDNTNLEVSIYEGEDSDIVLKAKNLKTINSNILHTETPTYISSKLLQVASLTPYNVGDVLVINKPSTMTTTEYELYYSNKNTRFTIQTCFEESGNYYIVVDNSYPWSSSMSYVFSFTRFPSTTIVYLNELYIKGNPVISLSTDVETKNSSSIDLYEEQTYEIDGRFYCNKSSQLKNMLQYFIDNFASIKEDSSDYRQIYSVKLRDKYEIQKGDVIRLRDNIYTGIDDSLYFYVLGCNHSAKTPEVTYDIIQVSTTDADGSDIEFTEQLDYTAVTTVNYVYTDSSADVGASIVSDTDTDLGSITIQRVQRSYFRADVSTYGDNYIVFSNLTGSYLEKYTNTFFVADAEYVVLIDSEFVYVKWSTGNEVSIIKRGLFGSTQTTINTNSTVTFYTITAGVTVSGYLSSTSMYVGNSTDHIKFTPLAGMEVKTSGEVTIENNNNRLYFDPATTNNKSQILLGVNWKDGNGNLKPEYDGVEFQVGEENNGGYLKFDNDTGLSMNVGNSTDHIKFTPLVGAELKITGEVTIENNNTRLYFDPATTNNKSQILLGVNWKDGNGNLKPEYDGVEFQVGSTTSENGYFKYDDSEGLSMNVKNFSIKGQNIIKSVYSSLLIGESSSNVKHSIVREISNGTFLTVGIDYNNFTKIEATVLNNKMEIVQKYSNLETATSNYPINIDNLYVSSIYNKALFSSKLVRNSNLLRVQMFDPLSTDNLQTCSTLFTHTVPTYSGGSYPVEIAMKAVKDLIVIAYSTNISIGKYNIRFSAYNFDGSSLSLITSLDSGNINFRLKDVFYFNSKYYAIIYNNIYEITSGGFVLYRTLPIGSNDYTYFNGYLYITQPYSNPSNNLVSYKTVRFDMINNTYTDVLLTGSNYGRISSNGTDQIVVYSDGVNPIYLFISSDGIEFERVLNNDDKTASKSSNVGIYNVEKSAIFYGVSGGGNKVILGYAFSNGAIKI